MIEVANSIKKYIKHPSDDFTDIYNRCYEAVWKALTDSENIPKDINTVGYWLEYFHSQIFTEFHKYRKENQLDADFIINGNILSRIIASAKLNIWDRMIRTAGTDNLGCLKRRNNDA